MATGSIKSEEIINGLDITSQISKTSGDSNITNAKFSRYGKLCCLSITINSTAAVPVGDNAFVGTIPSAYAAMDRCSAVGYAGSTAIVFYLTGNSLRARVIGSQLPINYSVGTGINYLGT